MGKPLPRTADHSPSLLPPHQTGVSFSQVGKIINISRSSSNTWHCHGQNNSQKVSAAGACCKIASKLFIHHPSSWQASSEELALVTHSTDNKPDPAGMKYSEWRKRPVCISIWATWRATCYHCNTCNSSFLYGYKQFILYPTSSENLKNWEKHLKYYLL